jgi:sulfopyruvate decarboxylase subunit alpha
MELLKKNYVNHSEISVECNNSPYITTMERKIISFLKENGYDFGATFPCSRLSNLFDLLENEEEIQIVPLTREEEGIGICTGAYMAGKKPFMLIQSSGLGNSFNAIASLLKIYRIPLLILASYRGYHNERILAQIPLGQSIPSMLDAMKVPFIILNDCTDRLETFCKKMGTTPHVVLLSPEMLGNA